MLAISVLVLVVNISISYFNFDLFFSSIFGYFRVKSFFEVSRQNKILSEIQSKKVYASPEK